MGDEQHPIEMAATTLHRTFLRRELLPVLRGRYRRRRLATPTLVLPTVTLTLGPQGLR
jgi:hypothetical protein